MNVVFLVMCCFWLVFPHHTYATTSSFVSDDQPSLMQLYEAALRYAHLESATNALWKKRARSSKWLPRFNLDFAHRTSGDVDIDINDSVYVGSSGVTVGPESGSFSQKATKGSTVGVSASWSLDELLFSADELRASAETRHLADMRQRLLQEVNHAFHIRQKCLGEIHLLQQGKIFLKPQQSKAHEIFLKEVELHEAEASLDALTGGWFQQWQQK